MPLVIFAIAFGTFTTLLFLGRIGEASYCFLFAASALFGLVLHGFARLKELDLKNLRVVLRELKQTKEELFVREEKLKAIALPLAEMIAFAGASEGRMGSKEFWPVMRGWYKRKLQGLIEALELNPVESSETQKYIQKYEEIDRALAKLEGHDRGDPEHEQAMTEAQRLSAELVALMKVDPAK
jgi:hypothetical protein